MIDKIKLFDYAYEVQKRDAVGEDISAYVGEVIGILRSCALIYNQSYPNVRTEYCHYANRRDCINDEDTNKFNEIYSVWMDRLNYARELWVKFGDVPLDPITETIEIPWENFPVGTHREEIWHWFEETFHISVAEDLMNI